MKFFLDTADIAEIKTGISWGVVDGVTTNPSLYAKVGGSYEEILQEICALTKGPVSAEVVSDDADGMVKEGLAFAKIASNIVVKVALTTAGLEAISRLKSEGIKTNCTLIFTANQGLMAAKAGASLISPFVGRLDDISEDGMTVIRELAEIFANYEGLDHCEILAASIRHPRHVTESALAGAHVATMPLKVLEQMTKHPLTDKGIAIFKADWAKAKGVK
ncbi:MAG: fructose-6-phosphate aldolase [Candidatus Limnocylindrus sp.]|jgi:transaldolase